MQKKHKTRSLLKLTPCHTQYVWKWIQTRWPCDGRRGRSQTWLGVVCVCVDFYKFFWSEETLFRRSSVFKAQTRRGSVFQAAEVVMKAGGSQSGVSVSGGEGGLWRGVFYWRLSSDCRRSCSSQTSECKNICKIFLTIEGKLLALDAPLCWHHGCPVPEDFESANVLPLLV